MEYHNFDLWIEARTADGYPLRAASEQGEARGFLKLDPMSESLQAYQRKLEIEDIYQERREKEVDADFLEEFGTFLYHSLFTGDVEALFQASLGAVGQEEQGLRIRLRINPPEISALPWEYLYAPRRNYFLGASKKTSLTRYLEVFQTIPDLRVVLPIKVLVAIPSGSGLDTEKEMGVVTEALSELGDAVQITPLKGVVTRSALADALLKDRYHFFHFIGHGGFDGDHGVIVFNDESGGHDYVSDDIFARFFIDQPSMKLVILNSCKGAKVSSYKAMVGMAPKLVKRGIPAVIAHQYSVTDEAAVRFSREFYRHLCAGREPGHVDAAMAHARNQLSIQFPDDGSQGAPVLFMRAPDGMIFEIERVPPPPSPAPSPIIRLALINKLSNLTDADLSTLILALHATKFVPRKETIQARVSDLVVWAEAATGPGLEEVDRVAKQVIPGW